MKDKIKNRDKSDAALPARTEALLRALLPFGVKWVTTELDASRYLHMWDDEPIFDSDANDYYCPSDSYLGTVSLRGLGLDSFAKINIEELAE